MVFGLGSLEQMELDETRHALQIRVTAQPDFLEGIFSASFTRNRFMAMNIIVLSPDAKARSSSAIAFYAITDRQRTLESDAGLGTL